MDPYSLPPAAFMVWHFMDQHSPDGACLLSVSAIARGCHMHRNTVHAALKELAKREIISRSEGSFVVQKCTNFVQKCTTAVPPKNAGTKIAKSSTAVHVVHRSSTPAVRKASTKASTPLPPTGGCLFNQKNNSFPNKPITRRSRRMDTFAAIPADATYQPPTPEQTSEARRLLELWNTTFPATVRRSCNQILDQISLTRLLQQDYTSQQLEAAICYLRKDFRIRFWPRPSNLLHQTRQGMVAMDKILMDIDFEPKKLTEQEETDLILLSYDDHDMKRLSDREQAMVLDARQRARKVPA